MSNPVRGAAGRLANRFRSDRYVLYLVILLLSFFLFHLSKSMFLGVHVDEANWWMQSKHLSAAYYFHPPFTAFMVRIGTLIFGEGALGLRMATIIFATASLALVYILALDLGSTSRWAFFTTLLIALVPLTNYWLTMVVVDTPMIFFALLTAILAWRAVSRERGGYWYLAGVSSGFMLLSKLQSGLFLFGILLFLLTSRGRRSWLKRKEPYLALAIAFLIMAPTFAWYAHHDFEPITYQLSNRPGFLDEGFANYLVETVKHVGWEMIALSPFVYLFSLFGLVCGGYLGVRDNNPRLLFLFWFALPGIALFTLTTGPPRWGFSSHIFSLVLAMSSVAILLDRSRHRHAGTIWRTSYIVLLLVPSLLILLSTIYVNAAGSSVHTGWDALADRVMEVRSEMEHSGSDNPVIASPYYFISSEIAYWNRDEAGDYTIAFRVYENEVMCDSSSYAPWVPLESLAGRDFVFVDEKGNPDGFNTPVTYWMKKLEPYFEEISSPEIFVEKDGGGGEREFYIFKCYGFAGPDDSMDSIGEVRDFACRL